MSADTIRTTASGYEYVVVHFYSSGEAKANILPTVTSFFELMAAVGLLIAIVLSAIFTRKSNDPNLFVRTSLVFYFVSALACEALSALSGVMTATWVSDMQVFSGGLCTAQGFFRHFSDVGLAIWTVVITVQAFIVLWRAQQHPAEHEFPFVVFGYTIPPIVFDRWIILAATWSSIGFIVMLGPAIGSSADHGDFYGVFGESCGITAGYIPESVLFSSLVLIIAATTSIVLFVWISYAIKPRGLSESNVEDGFSEKNAAGNLSVEVARYMTWYPLVYFVCVLPALIETIIFWSGAAIPVGYSVFVDTVYHLMGIINASIFVFTPHPGPLLPHRPESPLPPPKPRDLEAEAEKVKAQIIAAGVSLDGEPIDATPPPPPGESKPLERRPSSRARESPFPVHTREALGHDSKMESDGQDDAPVGKQNDTVSTDKTEARVPSSIYSQPSAALSSPLSIVVPSRAAKRTVRDPLAAIITIPKNPRPTGVTLRRVESTPQHAEVIVVTTPPLYHSPPSPQTAPPVFDLAFGAAFLV